MDVDVASLDGLAVVIRVEDVADLSSVCKWSVWNSLVNGVATVGEGDKEVSSSEGIEVVELVLFFESVVPDLMSLSGLVDGSGHLVDVGVGVHGLPERLSVLWVIATGISLLGSVVVEGDTSSGEGEGQSGFETLLVVELIKESGVVVVIDEETKSINVLEVWALIVVSLWDQRHGFS